MPPINKHASLSLKRTGKEYREVHEWMDGKELSQRERLERHKISNIPKFLPSAEKTFGKEGAQEYLLHIEDDYEHNPALKLWRLLGKLYAKW